MALNDRDRQLVEKLLSYCRQIDHAHAEYGRSYDRFCSNPTYRNAVALCLLQIGELTGKLSDPFKSSYPHIPWRAIRGMRNVVAHEYGRIDVETVWETAEGGINELKAFCSELLDPN